MEEINKKIILLYEGGVSNKKISSDLNIHRSTVQKILKRNGTKLHKRKSEIICNKCFFSEYNENSCYWAGFILADGYIRKTRNSLHIKLKKEDREHLVKFLKCLEIEKNSIEKLIKEGKDYFSIDLHFDELKNDLELKFKIKNKKTFDAEIFYKIPQKYIHHFIRGYFDGDGSISRAVNKKGIIYPQFSFIGTIKVLDTISNYFFKNGIKTRNETGKPVFQLRYKKNVGSIYYFGYKKLILFHKLLYKNSNELIELKRKKETILDFINIKQHERLFRRQNQKQI